jgi:hypothetical protein
MTVIRVSDRKASVVTVCILSAVDRKGVTATGEAERRGRGRDLPM